MQKIIFTVAVMIALCACNSNAPDEGNKIKLAFDPGKNKTVKMKYDFTVNSATTGNKTHFVIDLSGTAETNDPNTITFELQNNHISMDGIIQGKEMKFEAGAKDSVPPDVSMVLTPVFSLLDKKFRSIYDSRMNKISEVMVSDSSRVDSAENKMQFFIRYPENAVAVGESWQRELVIKSGNKMNCSATYTLSEVKNGKAIITMNGKLNGEGESFGHEFSVDGQVTGTFTVDVKNGWPLSSFISQEFTLYLNGQKIQMEYLIKHEVMP